MPIRTWLEKTLHAVEIHWLSKKVRAPGAAIYNDDNAERFLGDEATITIYLFEKTYSRKYWFLLTTTLMSSWCNG